MAAVNDRSSPAHYPGNAARGHGSIAALARVGKKFCSQQLACVR